MASVPKPAPVRRASTPSRRRPRLLAPLLAAVALGTLAAAAPASAATVQQGTISDCKPARAMPLTADTPASPELTSILGVLRRPATDADRLAPSAFDFTSAVGVSPDGIRLAGVGADGRSYFVLPGRGDRFEDETCTPARGQAGAARHAKRRVRHVPKSRRASAVDGAGEPVACLVVPGRTSLCVSASVVATHGVLGVTGRAGSTGVTDVTGVTGLVPDGVAEVILTYPGTSATTVAVEDNFFSTESGPGETAPDRVQWRMTDGSVRDIGGPGGSPR